MNMVNSFEIFDYFNFFKTSAMLYVMFLIWRILKKSMIENIKK